MFFRKAIRRGFLWWGLLISQPCYPQLVGIDRSEWLFPPDVLNLFGRAFRKPEARRRLAGLHVRYGRDGLNLCNWPFISECIDLSDCGANRRGGRLGLYGKAHLPNDRQICIVDRAKRNVWRRP